LRLSDWYTGGVNDRLRDHRRSNPAVGHPRSVCNRNPHEDPGHSPGTPAASHRKRRTRPTSFQGGKKTAATGLLFHFLIAFAAAAIYYQSSRRLLFLIDHPFFSGILYGTAVHLVMSRIVLPLSAASKREFSAKAFLTQLAIHIVFVGLPIALTVSHLSR
jgi:hypothetical protein